MDKHDVFKISLSFGLPLELEGAMSGNRQPFVATITFAGMPSDGPVGGTDDIPGGPYRILMPVELMQAKLEELIGKGVFAAPGLDTHAGTTRIGTFGDAWAQRFPGTDIEAVKASGFFDKGRDKDLVGKVIERARAGELGFSYDLKNAPVEIVEHEEGEMIAQLLDFEWRGATVLYRQTAAYQFTDLAAHLAGSSTSSTPGSPNNNPPTSNSTDSTAGRDPSKEDEVTKEQLEALFASNLKPVTDGQKAIEEKLDSIDGRVKALEGKAAEPPRKGKTADGDTNQISVKDLTSSIASAIGTELKEGLKELAKELKPADGGDGTRRTFAAEDIETFKRFGGEVGDEEEPTVDSLSTTIDAVKANAALSKSQKTKTVDTLVAMKLKLQRQERARVMSGMGGVQ